MACGDVGPIHEPMDAYTVLAKPTLAGADIRFAQVERVYSERGSLQVHSGGAHSRVKPHMASVFTDCGFDVVSLASNHAMDWGEDALLDTVALFRDKGIQVIGAGRNLREARRPAIVEKNGVQDRLPRLLLDPADGLRGGARQGRHRAAARAYLLRAVRLPGRRAAAGRHRAVRGRPRRDGGGHRRGEEDRLDVVVLSLHWGIHFIPRMIADYQVTVGQCRIQGRRRPDPRPSRAHAEGDRRAPGQGLLLQPSQLHHVLDRQDAGEGGAHSRSATASCSIPIIRILPYGSRRQAQPDRQGGDRARRREARVVPAGADRQATAARGVAPWRHRASTTRCASWSGCRKTSTTGSRSRVTKSW